ncbi:AfsA-related hotdog domain-containing protein [Streptomyces sp. NPDC048484]|uniref:AfsA-related hotdog domain-containing protein n=1 Tax=Streptomyces sp. NPDC048484 TaxID=3155146 RepID=UPI003444856A
MPPSSMNGSAGRAPSSPGVRWVVGESFLQAATQPDVITATQLRASLRAEPPAEGTTLRICPGLGVDETEWHDLTSELVEEYGCRVLPEGRPPRAVPRHRVLKHSRDNVVIGDAQAEEGRFSAWLAVVNDTEMLRDHTAEQQHVPGMLLIEAAIQAVTWAVSELYPAPDGLPPYYAVMHACSFDFRRFVFPLPTRLTGVLTQTAPDEPGKTPLRAEVRIQQAGKDCSTVRIDLRAFQSDLVFAVEDGQAKSAISRTAIAS